MSPLRQWACPPGKPTYGESHDPEYCVSECQDKCASPFLIAALTHSQQSNHHKGKYISATVLSGCNRNLYLERKVDYSDYMKNSFYAYRGTVMHQVVEDSAAADLGGLTLEGMGFLSEWRMSMAFCFEHGGFPLPSEVTPFDEATWDAVVCPECKRSKRPLKDREWFILGGTLDGLEPVWKDFDSETGVLPSVLWDLKTMQEYAVNYFIKGDSKNTHHRHVKDEHYYQAQVYRYLAERSTPPESLTKRGVTKVSLREANIQVFSMGQFPRTGAGYMWKDHYTKPETLWEIPSIEFESDEWVEAYIKETAYPIYKSLITGEIIPPICPPDKNSKGKHSWRCSFCAFESSQYCPNPSQEWEGLQQGLSPEEAFIRTQQEYHHAQDL